VNANFQNYEIHYHYIRHKIQNEIIFLFVAMLEAQSLGSLKRQNSSYVDVDDLFPELRVLH
jgi:hypothetical protein